MKHDKLFSTHVYLFDNVIDNNSLLQIRKDITSSYNQTTKNWHFKEHVDVDDVRSCVRFLTSLWFLNDIEYGGETVFTEQGLQQGTEYCYTVSAFNDNNESDQSNVACAETTEIYLEEPQNLTAEENGLEVYLDWEIVL